MKYLKTTLALILIFGVSFAIAQAGQENFEFRTSYAPSVQNYELNGDGFTTKTGNTMGSVLGLGFKWNRTEGSYHFNYQSATYQLKSPNGITPDSISADFKRYLLLFEPNHQLSSYGYRNNKFHYNVGLDFRVRSAGVTSPNIYLPETFSAGIRTGFGYEMDTIKEIFLDVGGGLFIPFYFDERTSKTGYQSFRLSPDFYFLAKYKMSNSIEIVSGVTGTFEKIYYTGTGNRGTSNGVESYLNLQIPIELRYQF